MQLAAQWLRKGQRREISMLHLIPNRFRRGLALSAFAVVTLASSAQAQSVFLQSGNGPVNGPDSLITFTPGPPYSDFSPLTPAVFAAAASGAPAFIFDSAETFFLYAPPTAVGPTCQWIGTTASSGTSTSTTAMFAIPFYWSANTANNALDITFSVDDQLGGLGIPGDPDMGMFIDGNPIANSASNVDWDDTVETYTLGLGSLSMGNHYLYFDDNNSGAGPAGLIFNATINAVPEPTPFAVLGLGALSLLRLRRRR